MGPSPPATSHEPLATSRLRRHGLSLLEVLFSMGILLVGLMGVAAMIPAGRHEILQGTKVDHASAVGRAAFRDLKIREYLEPERWADSGNAAIYQPPNPPPSPPPNYLTPWFGPTSINTNNNGLNVTPAVAIDPLGLGDPTDASRTFGPMFPFGAPAALALPRIFPDAQFSANPANAPLLADPVFRNADDLAFVPNSTLRDGSPEQMLFVSPSGTRPVSQAGAGAALKRLGTGDYSWLATVVTDPAGSALNGPVTVSVAVFHKRDLSIPGAGESIRAVSAMPAGNLGGGEVTIASPAGIKPVKPGAWIMLAGSVPQAGTTYKYFRWYRVVAADAIDVGNAAQNLTLAGADWNVPVGLTTAWLFDNIIAVYEKNLRLDFE